MWIKELLLIQRENNQKEFSEASVAEDGQSERELLAMSDGDFKSCENWILDSTYKFHMSPSRD